MEYRLLGNTGIRVSEIGFGAWGIGGLTPGSTSYGKTVDEDSIKALQAAYENGINFYDTSNVYGNGHSEKLLGKVFQNNRNKVVLASKAGFVDFDKPLDFSKDNIQRSLNETLNRLRTEYLDILQLHNITASELRKNLAMLNYINELKDKGTLKAIGISLKNPSDAFELLNIYPFEIIQANFNMLDIRIIQSGLLEMLLSKKIGFIARTPLAFGFLSGLIKEGHSFKSQDHRSRWSKKQIDLWIKGGKQLKAVTEESRDYPDYIIALRFCLSFSSVSTVIVGMLNDIEVAKNSMASSLGVLQDKSISNILLKHIDNNYFI